MGDKWEAVFTELEHQLRFDQLFEFKLETRNRTTMQCQRLLPDHHVALASPVTAIRRPGSDDPKGRHVLAFTDYGPWLFRASPANPGLPSTPIGPIADPEPITFSPHAREGGTLTIGKLTFIVPYLYADGIRSLIIELAALGDD